MRTLIQKPSASRRQKDSADAQAPNREGPHPGSPNCRHVLTKAGRARPGGHPSVTKLALSLREFAQSVAVPLHPFIRNLHLLLELGVSRSDAESIWSIGDIEQVAVINAQA